MVAELRKYLPGLKEYFQLAETPRVFADHDKWTATGLRALQLKQWKRGANIYAEMRRLGLSAAVAAQAAAGPQALAVSHRQGWFTPDSPPATTTAWECLDMPINLNLPNRRMRTRVSGGVAGE